MSVTEAAWWEVLRCSSAGVLALATYLASTLAMRVVRFWVWNWRWNRLMAEHEKHVDALLFESSATHSCSKCEQFKSDMRKLIRSGR